MAEYGRGFSLRDGKTKESGNTLVDGSIEFVQPMSYVRHATQIKTVIFQERGILNTLYVINLHFQINIIDKPLLRARLVVCHLRQTTTNDKTAGK